LYVKYTHMQASSRRRKDTAEPEPDIVAYRYRATREGKENSRDHQSMGGEIRWG